LGACGWDRALGGEPLFRRHHQAGGERGYPLRDAELAVHNTPRNLEHDICPANYRAKEFERPVGHGARIRCYYCKRRLGHLFERCNCMDAYSPGYILGDRHCECADEPVKVAPQSKAMQLTSTRSNGDKSGAIGGIAVGSRRLAAVSLIAVPNRVESGCP
jgi:hypothetical protein